MADGYTEIPTDAWKRKYKNPDGSEYEVAYRATTTFSRDSNDNPIKNSFVTKIQSDTSGNGGNTFATWTDGATRGKDGKWVPNKPNGKSVLGSDSLRDLNSTGNFNGQSNFNQQINNNTSYELSRKFNWTNQQSYDALNQSQKVPKPAAGGPNITPPPAAGATSFTAENAADLKAAVEDSGKTRTTYEDVQYPENLQLEHQDCIQFKILKYEPRTLNLKSTVSRTTIENEKRILSTITLPVPAGISDSNSVGWTKDDLGALQSGVADTINTFTANGTAAAGAAAQSNADAILGTGGEKVLKAIIAAKTTEAVLGGNTNVLSRQYGAISNPNSELLFSSTELRTFSFTFRMSPRSESEAIKVKKIIRYFKQAMSAKRSKSILLLKAPHTFAIKYLTSNKEHPYLNKFKECALTQCNVNYTPDGSYMTYDGKEPSMTAYEMQLQFQELEALFDDDYGNDNDNIGY